MYPMKRREKMKNKLIISILILAMSLQFCVFAEGGVNWSYENGVLTVWGNGDIEDYKNNSQRPWEEYKKEAKKLIIKEGITSVGDWSFSKFGALEEIEFPDTLKEIGERAFYNCSSVSYIKLPNGLKTIGNGAFNSCIGAVRVTLPDTLEKIGDSAFMNLPKIPVITIPKSVEHIGLWAFMGCTALEQLFFEGDVPEYVGDYSIADISENYILYYNEEYYDGWNAFDMIKEEKMMSYILKDRIPVYFNNSEICFDIDPIIVNGRTLVPMRAVFEALGAVVTWDGENELVTATKGETTVVITINSNTMRKNNQIISLDAPAMIYYDRTVVPVRAIFEGLGAEVNWDDENKTVISKLGDATVTMVIGEKSITVNDTATEIDVPAQIVNDRTLVPVRAVSESFGCGVEWDAETKTVIVTK